MIVEFQYITVFHAFFNEPYFEELILIENIKYYNKIQFIDYKIKNYKKIFPLNYIYKVFNIKKIKKNHVADLVFDG